MSKLADAIKRSQRTESTPMGFGSARPAAKPSMLVGFLGAAADVTSARDAGAEILIVDAHSSGGGLGRFLGASPELPADTFKVDTSTVQSPAGLFTDPDVEGVKAIKGRGFDFIVFEPGETPAAALLDEELGYVMALPSSPEDSFLRAVGSLQLEAIYFGDMPSPLTVTKQVELMRAASAGKPLLVRVSADVSSEELQCLRGAGVVGLLVASAEGITKVKETVAALPARKTRRDDARPVVSLPRGAAAEEHDHDDDDD